MKSWGRKAALVIGAGVLVLAVAVQLWRPRANVPSGAKVEGRLARLLPGAPDLWQSRDEALGHNEVVKAGVEGVLRFDDYVFRRYSRGGRWFSVYVAHWQPGKMPTRLVAEHTPDRCWVENGWVCDEREYQRPLELAGRALWPTEYRSFRAPGGAGDAHHVLFWLMVDGAPYDYRQHGNVFSHAVRWWSGAVDEFLRRRPPEHYFIRIASTSSWDELWREPGFLAVMDSVAKLGLYRPGADQDAAATR